LFFIWEIMVDSILCVIEYYRLCRKNILLYGEYL